MGDGVVRVLGVFVINKIFDLAVLSFILAWLTLCLSVQTDVTCHFVLILNPWATFARMPIN